jgi:hypothetical protein
MDFYKTIKILCLGSVLNPDEEYELRRIFRFYSAKFNTPLHLVPELPLEEILTAYFESEFEGMAEDKISSLAFELTETREEKSRKSLEEERRAVEDYEFLKRIEIEGKKGKDPLSKAADNLIEATKVLSESIKAFKPSKEAELPKDVDQNTLPPDVSISFTDDLDAEIEQREWSIFDDSVKRK